MTLELTEQAEAELWLKAEQQCPPAMSHDCMEMIYTVPSLMGRGTERRSQLYPGLELSIYNRTLYDVRRQVLESPHPVQFEVHLSGVSDSGDLPWIDVAQSYVGGSGIQQPHSVFVPQSQPQVGLAVHMEPDLLYRFFAEPSGELPLELQTLIRDEDCQRVFCTKTTAAMRTVVQQIIDCPFAGTMKRMYWQSKVMELIALQVAGIGVEELPIAGCLKPQAIDRIQGAAKILRSHLEDPPDQLALAQQVGMGKRTLQKGFQAVFGVTPFVYLTQQRMQVAKVLLRAGDRSVAEVANIVGYANPAQFAGAFRRQFGISPLECVQGKLTA